MVRKEINVFGTSFLDLLSGALAAVIILFVVVPKMSSADQEALREIEQAEVQIDDLANMIQQLENTIPQEQYDAIMQQIDALQQTIDQLSEQVQLMQQQLEQTRQENEQMRQLIEAQQQRISELEEELDRQRQASQMGKIFGIDAELAVVCLWTENADVDLFVADMSQPNGAPCYFNNLSTDFGQLNEDVQNHEDGNDDRYEMFYQRRLVPGRYLLKIWLYSENVSRVTVEGYVTLYPGKPNEKKIPYRGITLSTPREPVTIGTLIVTENNITLQQ